MRPGNDIDNVKISAELRNYLSWHGFISESTKVAESGSGYSFCEIVCRQRGGMIILKAVFVFVAKV